MADMFGAHNVEMMVLAPLMWWRQLSRPESMSSNSMKRRTTARVMSMSAEVIRVRVDLSR